MLHLPLVHRLCVSVIHEHCAGVVGILHQGREAHHVIAASCHRVDLGVYISVVSSFGKLVDVRNLLSLLQLLHFIDSVLDPLYSRVVDNLLHHERSGARAGGPIAHLGHGTCFGART